MPTVDRTSGSADPGMELAGIVAETAARVFADLADPGMLNRAADEGWRGRLWSAVEEAGLSRAWLDEDAGGAGLGVAATSAVVRAAGRFATPVALVETLLAGRLLAAAGLDLPSGELALAPLRPADGFMLDGSGRLSGRARAVPHLGAAAALVVLAESSEGASVALVPVSAVMTEPRPADLGGARADIVLADLRPAAAGRLPLGWGAERLHLLGAVLRAAEIAGALEAVLALSVEHAGTRVAFGRPIGRFQAIQHALARLAGEVAAALAVSGAAALAADGANGEGAMSDAALAEAAAAKIRCGEAAHAGAMIAHQVHGAIGWSAEHVLGRYTRRLWGWRDDFGDEGHWAALLGRHVLEAGADRLWAGVAVP